MTPKQAQALRVGDQVLTQQDQSGGSLIGFIQKIGEVNDHRYPGHFPVAVKVLMPTGRPFDFETSTKFLEVPGERLEVPLPIARIRSLASGQITMQTPDGDAFDMFAHQGKDLYEAPPELKPILNACEELAEQVKLMAADRAMLVSVIERQKKVLNELSILMGESDGLYGMRGDGPNEVPWEALTCSDGVLACTEEAWDAINEYHQWKGEQS